MSTREALQTVVNELELLLSSDGWQQEQAKCDDADCTQWIGPRVHRALDAASVALSVLNAPPSPDFQVRMESDEHGEEVFNYETLTEAQEGLERLQEEIYRIADGIERHLELVEVHDQLEVKG